jgi:hypothetical protein
MEFNGILWKWGWWNCMEFHGISLIDVIWWNSVLTEFR